MKTTFMKSLILLLSFAIAGTTAVEAKKADKKDFQKVLKEAVYYPSSALTNHDQGVVKVTYTLTDEGTIDIKSIESTNDVLNGFVKRQLGKIKYTGETPLRGTTLTTQFNFLLY
jgi:outer membrane biosynthesis protein TonB